MNDLTLPEPTKEIRKAYNELITHIQLSDIRLHTGRVSFAAKFPNPPGPELKFTMEDTAEYKTYKWGFRTRHRYDLTIKQGESEKVYVKISCMFVTDYRSEKKMTDELFDIFKKVNLPLNTWPYFREFVQSSTVRIGLPPLVLPVFQVLR